MLRNCAMLLFAILTMGLASCSDEATTAKKPTTPFTVWVLDERLTVDGEERPVVGATVAFDPGGDATQRIVKTTEPDGHATFDADFSGGGASVTVLSQDHVFVTMLEASPESVSARPNTAGKPASDLVVLPPRLDDATERLTVELRGNVLGWKAPTNEVVLAASALPRLGTATVLEPIYSMRAPKDRPFFILGHALESAIDRDGNVVSNEVIKSFRIEMPALAADALLDVDLASATALAVRPVQIRAELPEAFGEGTRAYASVISADSGVTPGIFRQATPTQDGRAIDVDLALVETDLATERLLTRVTIVAPDGSSSVRIEQGSPAGNAVTRDFAAPPTVPDPDAARTVRDAIPLGGFPAGADLVANVFAGGALVWVLEGPPGGPRKKAFTIPYTDELPSPNVQLFAVGVSARTDRVALPGRGVFYKRASTFRDVILRKL